MWSRFSEKPLQNATQSTQIPTEMNSGEPLDKIRPWIGGGTRHMEGHLGVTWFGSRSQLGSQETMKSTREGLIKEQSGFQIEIPGVLDRPLGGEDQVLRAEKEFVNHNMTSVDAEKELPLGEFQQL